MPLSAPEYWLEWTKNYFRCQFTHVGELIHKETWSAASFGWAEGLQMINPPIYRLTTAVSDIDQTNINRDIRDGNWLSMFLWDLCNSSLKPISQLQPRGPRYFPGPGDLQVEVAQWDLHRGRGWRPDHGLEHTLLRDREKLDRHSGRASSLGEKVFGRS